MEVWASLCSLQFASLQSAFLAHCSTSASEYVCCLFISKTIFKIKFIENAVNIQQTVLVCDITWHTSILSVSHLEFLVAFPMSLIQFQFLIICLFSADYVRYAFGLVSDYLSSHWSESLKESLRFSSE